MVEKMTMLCSLMMICAFYDPILSVPLNPPMKQPTEPAAVANIVFPNLMDRSDRYPAVAPILNGAQAHVSSNSKLSSSDPNGAIIRLQADEPVEESSTQELLSQYLLPGIS
jgi:hypothetical protein